jgi:hypothetical protein
MTHTLPHHETEHQRSVNNIWSCILGNRGILRIGSLITELLTAPLAKNATDRRQNTYSKIINVADCKTSKKRSLAVKYLILIMFNYPTAKTRTLYKSTDGPAGRPADNPPNPDGLGDWHRNVPELTVRVCWQPGPPICQRFGYDPDPDPMWRAGTVANTRREARRELQFYSWVNLYLCKCRDLSPNIVYWKMRDCLGAGDSWFWSDAVCSVCTTQCMLYSGYAVLGVHCTRGTLYSGYAVLSVNC